MSQSISVIINAMAFGDIKIDNGKTREEAFARMEELDESICDCLGLSDKNRKKKKASKITSESPWAWTGRDYPVGSLMQLAVENPKDFCELLVKAYLRPPPKKKGRAAPRHS